MFNLIQALSSFLAYESWLPSIMTSISTRLISCKKNRSLSCLKHAMWIIPSFRGCHFLLSRPFNTSRFYRSDRIVYQFSHSFQRSSQAQLGSSTGHTGFLFGNSPCLCRWHIVLYHLLHFKALHKKGKIRGEQNVRIFLSYLTVFSSNTSHTAPKSSNDPYTCSIIRLSSRLWIRWPHPSPWVDVLRRPNNLIWHRLFLLLRISPHQAPEACMALCLSDLGCLVPFWFGISRLLDRLMFINAP